jgi:hypothetical protein
MIVLRGWFELGQISEPKHNEGDNGRDHDDDHHDDAYSLARHYPQVTFFSETAKPLRTLLGGFALSGQTVSQYKISKIKLLISMTAVTPAMESANLSKMEITN